MKISIIGLGWFGSALAEHLKKNHEVIGTTRSEEKFKKFEVQKIKPILLPEGSLAAEELFSSDVIVINIPPFPEQLGWFKSWPLKEDSHVIFISSTSVYGNTEANVDERSQPSPSTENAKLLWEEEQWVSTFKYHTIIRFGGLLGNARHPGKYLSGKTHLTDGDAPVNLVHLNDAVGFTCVVIEKKLRGEIFNLVSPEHPTRKEYYQNYCRDQSLPLPHFATGGTRGKIVSSAKAMSHYQFTTTIRNA